jgi:hypothetical protein
VDVVLPVRDRIMPCVFAMVTQAYNSVYSAEASPSLARLLPCINIDLHDVTQ